MSKLGSLNVLLVFGTGLVATHWIWLKMQDIYDTPEKNKGLPIVRYAKKLFSSESKGKISEE